MKLRHLRNIDLLYAIIWVVVALLYLLDIIRARISGQVAPVLDLRVLGHILLTLLPFFLLFLYNNYLLLPRLLLPGHTRRYLLGILAGLAVMITYQYLEFSWHESIIRHRLPDPLPFEPPKRLFPLPLLLDFIYDVLVIGGNIAISLAFQRYYDRLDRERLLKANAQSELSYLKAQINPHFYMNMLNNIHGMIEIDAEGAQQMVIDMSHLMRYMLYDSSRATTTLDKEVEFISTYLSIMRRRYPRERVEISARLPEGDILRHIELPPLLFLVFIENAFKHGISYRRNSFVAISLSIEGDTLDFSIINSRPQEPPLHSASGIGLTNIRQRLDLIYGSRALLDITETPQSYTAHLTIPIHEAENHCD